VSLVNFKLPRWLVRNSENLFLVVILNQIAYFQINFQKALALNHLTEHFWFWLSFVLLRVEDSFLSQ